MISFSRQTLSNPELFAVCARRMTNQELLKQIEWMPDWAEGTVRLARQILFDRIVKHYEAPPEFLELLVEEKAKKPKHDPGTRLMSFECP